MNPDYAPPSPLRLEGPSGLSIDLNANGSLRRMDHGDILLNLFPGNEMEGGPANIYLRRLGDIVERSRCWARSPLAPLRRHADAGPANGRPPLRGRADPGRLGARVVLARDAGEHAARPPSRWISIHAQDLALATTARCRMNEYYVSQYVDHTPLAHPERGLRARRAPEPVDGRPPAVGVIGSLGRGVELRHRRAPVSRPRHPRRRGAGRAVAQGLPGTRQQHEHSMAVIQDAPVRLAPGATAPNAGSSAGSSPITRPPRRRPTSRSSIAPSRCRRPAPPRPAWPLRRQRAPGQRHSVQHRPAAGLAAI